MILISKKIYWKVNFLLNKNAIPRNNPKPIQHNRSEIHEFLRTEEPEPSRPAASLFPLFKQFWIPASRGDLHNGSNAGHCGFDRLFIANRCGRRGINSGQTRGSGGVGQLWAQGGNYPIVGADERLCERGDQGYLYFGLLETCHLSGEEGVKEFWI